MFILDDRLILSPDNRLGTSGYDPECSIEAEHESDHSKYHSHQIRVDLDCFQFVDVIWWKYRAPEILFDKLIQ